MLQQFFALFITFIIFIIFVIASIIIKMGIPIWRFMSRADAVIELYAIMKEVLKTDFSKEEKIEVSYGKYKLNYSNTNEASIEFEKIVDDALEYYDKLGWIATLNNYTLEVKKDELIYICSEVRMLRWKKQGV